MVSAEGAVFYVEKRVAEKSKLVRDALASGSMESMTKEFKFPEISSTILEIIVEYLHYNYKYQWLIDHNLTPSDKIPAFTIQPEHGLEVLVASLYLQC